MRRRYWIWILSLIIATSALAAVAAAPRKPAPSAKAVSKATSGKPALRSTAAKKPGRAIQARRLPRLLDLGSDSCIPCKMMVPVLNGLRKDYKGKLTVEFIDVWKQTSAKDKYKIKVIPTQIFYDSKGKELSRHEGYLPREDILAEFKKLGIKL